MTFVCTPRALERACVEQRGFAAPELNEVLYLHHRGIVRLEHFDPYVNLRCLHLERNAVSTLEGLGTLRSLTQLHVDGNALSNLRGVERLVNLERLDASDNVIDTLEHARGHEKLRSLTLARNNLRGDVSLALAPLAECPALRALDVSENALSARDADAAERVFATTVPNLEIFTAFKGNPILTAAMRRRKDPTTDVEDLRRPTTRACPRLAWLDGDPVAADARARPSTDHSSPDVIDERTASDDPFESCVSQNAFVRASPPSLSTGAH